MRIYKESVTRLTLDFYEFYQKGYSHQQIKEVVENISDFNGTFFQASFDGPLDRNAQLLIETVRNDDEFHELILFEMELALEKMTPAVKLDDSNKIGENK